MIWPVYNCSICPHIKSSNTLSQKRPSLNKELSGRLVDVCWVLDIAWVLAHFTKVYLFNKAAALVELVDRKLETRQNTSCAKELVKDSVKKLMESALPLNANTCIATVIAVKQPKGRTNKKMTQQTYHLPCWCGQFPVLFSTIHSDLGFLI